MAERGRNPVPVPRLSGTRWRLRLFKRWRRRPPIEEAGVREPRRPKPTLPAAAVALDEPRTEVRRWLKLTTRRDWSRRSADKGRRSALIRPDHPH
jgi:hypothetical protein